MSAELMQVAAWAIVLGCAGLIFLLFLGCLIKTLKAIRDCEIVDAFVGLFGTVFLLGLFLVVIGLAAEEQGGAP